MRNKESETLYPVSTVLCVSQRPGPIIHSSSPYLSLLRMKDKQKPKSSWLAWCFFMKALLLSLDPLLIQCPQVSSLDRTLSFSLNAPLPPLLFPLFSPFLYFSKNKALLMTVGSQGPAGARVLKVRHSGNGGGGTSSFSSSPFITGENRGSRGVNVLLLHRGLGYHHGSKHVEYQGAFPSFYKRGLFVTCFFGLWVQLHFQIVGWKRFSFDIFK